MGRRGGASDDERSQGFDERGDGSSHNQVQRGGRRECGLIDRLHDDSHANQILFVRMSGRCGCCLLPFVLDLPRRGCWHAVQCRVCLYVGMARPSRKRIDLGIGHGASIIIRSFRGTLYELSVRFLENRSRTRVRWETDEKRGMTLAGEG